MEKIFEPPIRQAVNVGGIKHDMYAIFCESMSYSLSYILSPLSAKDTLMMMIKIETFLATQEPEKYHAISR